MSFLEQRRQQGFGDPDPAVLAQVGALLGETLGVPGTGGKVSTGAGGGNGSTARETDATTP